MKIGKKFVLVNIIVTFLAMSVLSVVIIRTIMEEAENTIIKDLITSNEIVTSRLENPSNSNIVPRVDLSPSVTSNNVYIYIYDVDNNFTYDNYKNADNRLIKDRIVENSLQQPRNEISPITINDMEIKVYLTDLVVGEDKYTIITAIPNDEIYEITSEIVKVVLITISIIGIAIIIFLNFFSRKIIAPMNPIIKGIDDFADKKFDNLVKVSSKDEFGILAEELNAMAISLQKNDVEQRKFYEDFSHDLKTPIAVISGYAECLKSGIIKDSDESLVQIVEECQKLKKQIENMIYLSKLDTIKENMELEKIAVKDILSDVITEIDSLIIINEIDVEFEVGEDLFIIGDKEKLARALRNIISNAIKHTKDVIRIEAYAKESMLSESVNASQEIGNEIVITISDNGKGFAKEILNDPFSRVKLESYDGSNIGLSIVKKIIDKHNGKVAIYNSEKGGAICKIVLP